MGDLILQHNQVSRRKMGQHLVHILPADLRIGAGNHNDAVLPLCINLNHRVAVGPGALL